ncbi:MAG: aldehyde ferredoxin oxidoreductase family protein [Thermodesulfobacteriota bacterium]
MVLEKGYAGRVLRVNLSTGKSTTEELREDAACLFIGGRGLGAKYLFDEVTAGADPLGEDNKLYFLTSPLAGTSAQASSRWMVVTKSPLSGAFIRSTGGGNFGHELKVAGIDLLVIEGKAEKPTTIVIQDNEVTLKDAAHLWGKEIATDRLQETLRRELGDEKLQIACIGSTGENGTLYAAIMSGRRSASRGGVGTVMGCKNLKAIAVRGSGKIEAADREKLQSITRQIVSDVTKTDLYKGFSHLGTSGMTALMHEMGMHPVKNFQKGLMPDFSGLEPDKLEEIFQKNEGCFGCFIKCGCVYQVKEGRYKGGSVVGPEYETMWSFGANLYNTDLGFVMAANKLCDDYGLDTISAGSSIGFAMELFEKGILSASDLDGLDLSWGNHQAAYKLLKKIVKREGIGDILALGTRKAAHKIGKNAEKYAMHVKGLEIPAYEPRSAKGHGLNLATSNIGASHMTGYCGQELFGIPERIDRFTTEGKGALTKFNQDNAAAYDSLLICGFPASFQWMGPEHYAKFLFAATGIEEFADKDYILRCGERIYTIERAFNARDGFARKDDRLPERFIKEPIPDGPCKGQIFEMDMLLDDYYKARGWDIETGFLEEKNMLDLGLKSEAAELKKAGRLKG